MKNPPFTKLLPSISLIFYLTTLCAQGQMENTHLSRREKDKALSTIDSFVKAEGRLIQTLPRLLKSTNSYFPLVVYCKSGDDSLKYEFTDANSTYGQVTETCYSFYSGSWVPMSRICISLDGRVSTRLFQEYYGSEWKDQYRYTDELDAEGHLISVTNEYKMEDGWYREIRIQMEFENGNLRTRIREFYDKGMIVLTYKENFSYGPRGDVLSFIAEINYGEGWTPLDRGFSDLNISGKTTMYHYQVFRNGVWKDSTRVIYNYYDSGLVSEKLTERFTNLGWEPYIKFSHKYNALGLETELKMERFIGFWEARTKFIWEYNENNSLKSEILQKGMDQQWINFRKTNWEYYKSDLLSSELVEYWAINQWENSSRYFKKYDENDQLNEYTFFSWDSEWIPGEGEINLIDPRGRSFSYFGSIIRCEYAYVPFGIDGKNSLENTIHLYPNPFIKGLFIQADLPDNHECKIEIHALNGQLVYSDIIRNTTGNSIQYYWNGQDGNNGSTITGTYIVTLNYNGKRISKIVQKLK